MRIYVLLRLLLFKNLFKEVNDEIQYKTKIAHQKNHFISK